MNVPYVYDRPDWAIHNVGRYWASVLSPDYKSTFHEESLKIFTRANNHRRKNLPLFRELQAAYQNRAASFDGHIGLKVLPEPDYIRLIDRYNCYLCTSWQEGGATSPVGCHATGVCRPDNAGRPDR
jgi:hypothetical protein